jgi:hypothetical protein
VNMESIVAQGVFAFELLVVSCQLPETAGPSTVRSPDPQRTRIGKIQRALCSG